MDYINLQLLDKTFNSIMSNGLKWNCFPDKASAIETELKKIKCTIQNSSETIFNMDSKFLDKFNKVKSFVISYNQLTALNQSQIEEEFVGALNAYLNYLGNIRAKLESVQLNELRKEITKFIEDCGNSCKN